MQAKLLLAMVATTLVLPGCINMQITPAVVSTNAKDIVVEQQYKAGKSCAQVYLGLGPFGDMTVQSAARKAGVSKIVMVDYQIKSYIVYANLCTVVRGE